MEGIEYRTYINIDKYLTDSTGNCILYVTLYESKIIFDEAYLNDLGIKSATNKDYVRSIREFEYALKVKQLPDIYYNKTISLYLMNTYDSALIEIENILKLNQDVKYLIMKGILKQNCGDYKGALDVYNKMGKSALSLCLRGNLYLLTNRKEEALKDFREVETMKDSFSSFHECYSRYFSVSLENAFSDKMNNSMNKPRGFVKIIGRKEIISTKENIKAPYCLQLEAFKEDIKLLQSKRIMIKIRLTKF